MVNVTIYTTGETCMQCKMTKRLFDAANVHYVEIDIRDNADARAYVTEDLGYSQAPVVVVEDGTGQDHWSGLNPDEINRIITANTNTDTGEHHDVHHHHRKPRKDAGAAHRRER